MEGHCHTTCYKLFLEDSDADRYHDCLRECVQVSAETVGIPLWVGLFFFIFVIGAFCCLANNQDPPRPGRHRAWRGEIY